MLLAMGSILGRCESSLADYNLLGSLFRSLLVLNYPFLDESCHERDWERFVRREVDRGTANIVPFEFCGSHGCEFENHARTHGKERAVVLGRA